MREIPSTSALNELADRRVGSLENIGGDPFREAIASTCGETPAFVGARAGRWASRLLESEGHVRATGRRPRESTRDRGSLPASERRLAEWARRQRDMWGRGRLTPYQRARLEVSPAFELDRRQARWDAQLEACFRFVVRRGGRLPVMIRGDLAEFGLARWWHLQVSLLHASRLPADRAAAIGELLSAARSASARRGGVEAGDRFLVPAANARVVDREVQIAGVGGVSPHTVSSRPATRGGQ